MLTWMEMFNDLRSDPELRDHYQFWFYLYPTGQPFWVPAAKLRDALAEMRRRVDPQHADLVVALAQRRHQGAVLLVDRALAAEVLVVLGDFQHPLAERREVRKRALIIISTDKGLCGGLNTNVLRMALAKMREWEGQGEQFEVCAIGNKGLGFMQRLGANIVAYGTGRVAPQPRLTPIDRKSTRLNSSHRT